MLSATKDIMRLRLPISHEKFPMMLLRSKDFPVLGAGELGSEERETKDYW